VVPEAPSERTEDGLVVAGDGWFVLNARDARWRDRPGRGRALGFEGKTHFPQLGVALYVLAPGEPIGMYHWEANQEDFLVVDGEALLLIEGQERPLRQWDFVHCPVGASHIIIGAGDAPCVLLAVGARGNEGDGEWGMYPVAGIAKKHGVGVDRETPDAGIAYSHFPAPVPSSYGEGWLPGG
jgi:uncharacterized cupin superfamily protein